MSTPPDASFRVLAWNMKAGRDKSDVRDGLVALMEGRPEFVDLSEAGGYGGVIASVARQLGYRRIQELPAETYPRRGERLIEEDANIAVLARLDVGIASSRTWRMALRFTGPVNGWRHMPRVYRRLKVAIPSMKGWWRLSFGHWPTPDPASNAPAVAETERRVGRWFRLSRLPAVHLGDLNTGWRALAKRFPGLRVIEGHGPDNALTNGKVRGTARRLAKMGSDHYAVMFTFWAA